jgi:hypothetical protein
MTYRERIKLFVILGSKIHSLVNGTVSQNEAEKFDAVLSKAQASNQWFTKENILTAFKGIAHLLEEQTFTAWAEKYPGIAEYHPSGKPVGVIMPGNIPMVGFHDMLCVLLSGNRLIAKLSSDDKFLLPFIAGLLSEIDPEISGQIIFTEKLNSIDAAIATGSNNSARYFEYYFSKIPHIIRKNRNGVAVLTGDETEKKFLELGKDIFLYFGLGCRSVSKLYIPYGFDFGKFFQAIHAFGYLAQHNKYMNNYDYHRAIYLMNEEKFLTNNFLILKNATTFSTPVSVLNYEYYINHDLAVQLEKYMDKIQCVVSDGGLISNTVPFGQAQFPGVGDYADGIDTMEFLLSLAKSPARAFHP